MTTRVLDLVGREELSRLTRRTNVHALALLSAHVVALVAAGAWVWATRHSPWVLLALVVDGVVMAHLFALLHECSHRTPFRSPRVNAAVAHAAALVVGPPAGYFRLEHLAHHQHTQDPGRDPELITVPRSTGAYVAFVVGIPYWFWALRTLLAHAAGRILAGERSFVGRAERSVILEARLYLATYVIVGWLVGLDGLLWLWILPRLVGEPWMRIARLSEHAGRPLTRDPLVGTRSLRRVPTPLRLLAWNMPFHAEHHLAPGVPFHALPPLSARLGIPAESYLTAQSDVVRRIRTPETGPLLLPE